MDDETTPASIEVARDVGLTVTFLDGHEAHFDLMSLRLACPCATCRSWRDGGEDVWPRPGSPTPLRIAHAGLHGAWGLDVEWNDGHSTGIYPFEVLRRWSEGGQALPPEEPSR